MGKSVNQLVREYLEQLATRSPVEEEISELRRLSAGERGALPRLEVPATRSMPGR